MGDITGATALLMNLNRKLGKDAETQGILAGRFKRQWLKDRAAEAIGWRAFYLYKEAFDLAGQEGDLDQQLYNGINAAYLDYVLGGSEYPDLAQHVLEACRLKGSVDYWRSAAEGEAYLLLNDHVKALAAYKESMRLARGPRHINTTGQQALHIIEGQSNPPEAAEIKELFGNVVVDY